MNKRLRSGVLALGMVGALVLGGPGAPAAAQGTSRYFPETGHTVRGPFLAYWDAHGGLAQQGYPLGEEVQEVSPLDGKTYTMQYFERAVFERHATVAPPFDVMLSQLGTFRYRLRYPAGAPAQHASTDNPRHFAETGHTVGGAFRAYWEAHGGLAQQGFPISEEFQEKSDLDGQTYTVQYFERAVFERHPENKPPYDVLLAQIGKARWTVRQAKGLAATLPSPPRIYAVKGNALNFWPADAGSTVTYYSTCGAQPVPPPLAGAPGGSTTPVADPCAQPMTLTTTLASAAGGAQDVTFAATWETGARHHNWQFHIAGDKVTFVQETGDRLPILPQ